MLWWWKRRLLSPEEEGSSSTATDTDDIGLDDDLGEVDQDEVSEFLGADDVGSKFDPNEYLDPEDDDKETDDDKGTEDAKKTEKGEDEKKAEFDEKLIQVAKTFGVADSVIQKFTPEELREHLQTVMQAREQVAAQGAAAKTGDANTEQVDFAKMFEPFKLEIDVDEYDPEVNQALKGINEHYGRAVQTMFNYVSEMTGAMQTMHQQLQEVQRFDVQRQVDSFVDELDPAWKAADLFGDGPTQLGDESSDASKNRNALVRTAARLGRMYVEQGDRKPSDRELLKQALRMEFGDKLETISKQSVRRDMRSKLTNRARAITTPPDNRISRRRGDEEGDEAIREIQERMGIFDDGSANDGPFM